MNITGIFIDAVIFNLCSGDCQDSSNRKKWRIKMDFELTKSQIEIQKAARNFAKGEFDKDLALELEKKHEFPTKIWKKAAELGFIGIHFDEKYSGQGLGVIENIIVAEELCAKDSTIGAALILSRLCIRMPAALCQ